MRRTTVSTRAAYSEDSLSASGDTGVGRYIRKERQHA